MCRVVGWTGPCVGAAYTIVIAVLLYRQGLAADQHPGGTWTITPMLVALATGLGVIVAATAALARVFGRRAADK